MIKTKKTIEEFHKEHMKPVVDTLTPEERKEREHRKLVEKMRVELFQMREEMRVQGYPREKLD